MEERRHPTGAELDELYRRANHLIDTQGERGDGSFITKHYKNHYFPVSILLHYSGTLHIGDKVASCLVVDYANGGITQVAGATVIKVLNKLREIMVLDDLAQV